MERMLTVLFSDESKAYEGSRALKDLDSEGSISIYAQAVIKKNPDGTISIKQAGDEFPVRTVSGTAIGALIGLLGGPIGFSVGVAAGTLVGALADVHASGVNEDFLGEVSTKLTPGKWAVVSDVSEEWMTPVDNRMETLGGIVFRTDRWNFEDEQRAREVAALRAEIAQLKAEQAHARSEQKAKLQAKIDKSQEKLHAKLQEAKQRSERQRKETEAKIQALEQKAAKAKGEAKTALEARIASLRKEMRKSAAHTEWLQTIELPAEEEMVSEMEILYQGLPFDDYEKDAKKLKDNIERLEKEYDRREKVIGRIMEYGTGNESEKALRMYPTPVLAKWEASLETFRADKLNKPN
ncbi:MAG: DUF1269 domain-containing protein [Candidatus Bathyarchaeia archaeon]